MSNSVPEFVDIEITSEYGYRFNELQNIMQANLLSMEAMFQTADFMSSELDLIGQEFVNTAKKFAQQQGLGGGTSLLAWGSSPKNKFGTTTGPKSLNGTVAGRGPTGNLISSIHYSLQNNNITFYNDARNSRGQFYAGHIEYGFHDRGGNMVPARPFMRPALYAVADASKGRIVGTLKRYLEQMWAMESLQFGYPITPHGNYRAFYKLHETPWAKGYGSYTASRLPQGRLSQMRTREGRMKFTVDRTQANKKGTYSQRVSSRMGSKAGWYKVNGQSRSKGETRWTHTADKSTSTKSSYKGVSKQSSVKPKVSSNPYGKQSDYSGYKHFVDTHFKGEMRNPSARSAWKGMK